MASSLIRGRYVVSRVLADGSPDLIEDGGVFQRDGRIVEVGPAEELLRRHRPDEIVGSGRHVVVPGFVNGHHHMGVTPFQLGAPDLPLELWIARRMADRTVDPYLDTLYSAFELIESGVTTVQHIQYGVAGPVENIHAVAREVLRAYRDVGMRASYSYVIIEQNRLVYEPDDQFAARLPGPLGKEVTALLSRQAIPLEDNFSLFETLYREVEAEARLKVQLAPANLHWCSDAALVRTKEVAERFDVPMHLHLLETAYQKAYAERRAGKSAVEHIGDLGLLAPNLTLGHAVWFSERDIELAAAHGVHICHNASSNLRLRSGIAPVNQFAGRNIPVALGIDEAGLNDDRDMLQEMRLVLNLHRTPGMDAAPPTAAQILRMATEHGAHTTPFGHEIGSLQPGKAADCVLFDWERLVHPYLDAEVCVVDALIKRARASSIHAVMVEGEVIWRDGASIRLDRKEILDELAATLRRPLTAEEEARRRLAGELFGHVEAFYRDYVRFEDFQSFYPTSARR